MQRSAFVKHNTDLFSKVAPFYGALDIIVSRVRQRFVDFLALPEPADVLDAATGTGKQAYAFAASGHRVIGIDLSPHMLSIAARKNHFSNAVFAIGDACALPFTDAAFDLTSMSFALHCMPLEIRAQAVGELKRVTRPSGYVAFVDYGLPSNQIGREIEYLFVSLYETAHWREFIRSDFEKLLAGQGLRVVKQSRFGFGSMRMIMCTHM